MKKIYLDYAATSPVKPAVLKAMTPYFCDVFGNPSSIHSFGRKARQKVEESRKTIAKFINCDPEEIIFTSGGTESDNLAIRGLINALYPEILFAFSHPIQPTPHSGDRHFANNISLIKNKTNSYLPHIITSAFEHHAVLDTCRDLEKRSLAEVTYVKPDEQGIIHVEDIKKAVKSNTVLVSIMYVNNEIGTVQPIAEIAKMIKKLKAMPTGRRAKSKKLYLHTDAVQAVEYQEMDVKKLGVDMLSISAHKFGGPKGVGALYLKKGTPMHRENIGGAQEFKLRAGTENVAGIVGMAKAIDLLTLLEKDVHSLHGAQASGKRLRPTFSSKVIDVSDNKNNNSLTKLRNYFIDRILTEISDTRLNGSKKQRNPNNVNVSFKYIEGEAILLHLDMAGIAASSGSACTSGSLDPSHVLLAIGMRHEDAHGSIRFTLGEQTTKKEIDYVMDNLKRIIPMLREMSPFGK